MKVNDFSNEEIKTVDWNYVVSNEGIYEAASGFNRPYLINVDSLDGTVLVYKADKQTLEAAGSEWHDHCFTHLPNATLVFDVKE